MWVKVSLKSRTVNLPCHRHSVVFFQVVNNCSHYIGCVLNFAEPKKAEWYQVTLQGEFVRTCFTLDTYDLSAVFCSFRVVNRYLGVFISIRNQCKATNITSWTSQFHQRFNNIRTVLQLVLIKYAENCINLSPTVTLTWDSKALRSPTIHLGLDSHVHQSCMHSTPVTHALPHEPLQTNAKRSGLPMLQKTAFLFHFHCLPCRSHNYRGEKQVRENDRGKTFSLELEDGPVAIVSRKATRRMFVKPLCFSYFFLSQILV